jgi:hypothetical protein
VQEVRWRRSPADRRAWGTLPGSLLFPTGTSADTAWASLLHSPARLARVAVDSARYRRWHERITPAGGDEQLLRVERFGDQLPLAPAAPPDSVRAATASDSSRAPAPHAWVLRWPGLSPGTDLGPWLRRGRVPGAASGPAAFRLFAPDGLRATGDGGLTVLGTPPVRVRDGDRLRVVGRSAWARFQAQSLRAQARAADTTAVARWVQSDSSTWAAALRPRLERALRPLAAAEGPLQTTATYVRNWDHRYDRMSIGALVFDEWMRAYRAEIGRLPRPADTTAYFARYRLRRAFRRAHARLRARFGPDVRQWRWGRVATDRRYFPVWSADSLVARSLHDLSTTRYAPIDRTGRGHPSTLAGGPSRVAPLPVAPSPDAWEAWMPPGGPVTVRRHRYDPGRLFARSRLRTDPPRPHRLAPDSLPYKTLLLPAPQ